MSRWRGCVRLWGWRREGADRGSYRPVLGVVSDRVAPAQTPGPVVKPAVRIVGLTTLTVAAVLVAPVVGVVLALVLAQCAGVR